MLAELGIAPQLTHCAICGKDMLYHRRAPTAFSFPHGGTLCEQCAPDEAKIAVRLTPDAVAILRAWQTAPSWRSALRSKSTRLQFQIVATALGLFLNYHLDTMPVSRKIALSLLNGESAIRATGKARGSLT
jgi:recombinational DNA repair protein (RecF pathway)